MLGEEHATGEGYLRSPRDGSLRDIVAATLALEEASGVTVRRRLGVSLAGHLLARELGDEAAWGSEWVERRPTGPQGWWPAAQVDHPLIDSLAALGLQWLCIGSTAGEHVHRLVAIARDAGVSVALRPSLDALVTIERHGSAGLTVESLPHLVDALVARHADRPPAETASEALRRIASAGIEHLAAAKEWILASGVPLVPLMTAAARQASLRAVVRSPHLAEAATVLPYHERVASLRAPGAMRLGGSEASRNLGVPLLNTAAEKEVAEGIHRCRTILGELVQAHHPLLIGSGAPGIGLAPGLAWLDERALVAELGWGEDHA